MSRKIVVALLIFLIGGSLLAQEGEKPRRDRQPFAGGGVRPEIGRGPMFLEKQIIPTPDGGLIVSIGDKLIKYDKDLNLIKQVTLPSPLPPTQPEGEPPADGRENRR